MTGMCYLTAAPRLLNGQTPESTMRRRIMIAAISTVFASAPASAQTQPSWTVSSGLELFSLRDIARSGPPVDASPVSWEGSGPVVVIGYDRTSPGRRHGFEVSFANASGFEYRSPLVSSSAASGDSASRVGWRYEYDRRILSRHVPALVAATIGVRGSGEFRSLIHSVDPSSDIGLSTRTAAAAVVLGASIGRGRRLSGDVRYGNAAVFGWLEPNRETSGSFGAGWTTDLDGGVAVRMSASLALTARVLKRGDGFLSSHRSFSLSNPRFTVGVCYAR